MADLVLSSIWNETDASWGFGGAVWVAGHIEARRHDRTFVEEEPEASLMHELLSDRLRATGIFEANGQRRPIDGILWEDLKFGVSPSPESDSSAALRRNQIHGIPWTGHWTGILFERQDLVSLFPESAPEDAAKASVGQQSRCRTWLIEQMRSSPTRPLTKASFLAQARLKFGDSLPERSFNRAWIAAIEESGAEGWKRAGRPSGTGESRQ